MDISAIFLSYIMFILKSLILVISFILSLTGRCPKKPFSKGQCSSHEFLQDQEIYEVKQWKKGFRCNYLEKNKIFLQRWFNKNFPAMTVQRTLSAIQTVVKTKFVKEKKKEYYVNHISNVMLALFALKVNVSFKGKKMSFVLKISNATMKWDVLSLENVLNTCHCYQENSAISYCALTWQ